MSNLHPCAARLLASIEQIQMYRPAENTAIITRRLSMVKAKLSASLAWSSSFVRRVRNKWNISKSFQRRRGAHSVCMAVYLVD